MRLPFTIDQFLDVFRRYNLAVSPAQWVLVTLAVVAVVLAARDRLTTNRWVSAILALLWFWMAAAYHLAVFASVNRAAVAFAGVFAIQGGLFTWLVFRATPPSYRSRSSVATAIGALFIVYALLVYPALGYMLGHRYPAAPTFGVPCPTTIFTLGLLVWSGASMPRRVLVIPLAWSVIATSAATTFGMTEDFGLPAAAVVSVAWLMISRRGTRASDLTRSACRRESFRTVPDAATADIRQTVNRRRPNLTGIAHPDSASHAHTATRIHRAHRIRSRDI